MRLAILSFSPKEWLQFFCLLVAEIAVVWLAVNVLFLPLDSTKAGMSVLAVATLLGGASILPRLLHDYGLWGNMFGFAVALGIAFTTLLAIKVTAYPTWEVADSEWLLDSARSLALHPHGANVPVWAIVLASTAAWWRGATRERPAIDAGLMLLKAGAIVMLVAAIAHATMDSGASDREASAAILVFFGTTLSAIAMMRQDLSTWRSGSRWLETVLLPVLAITVPAALVVGLLSRDLSGMIDLLLEPLVWILLGIFRLLAIIIVVLAMIVLIPLLWLISLLPFSNTVRNNEESPGEMARTTLSGAADRAGQLPDGVRYLIVLVVLVAIYAGVARFRLRLGLAHLDSDSDLQSSTVEGSLLNDIRSWLRRVYGSRGAADPDPLFELRDDPRWRSTVIIRERYADFLQWTRENGIPRAASMTPDELAQAWSSRGAPSEIAAVVTITSIYDAVRYGNEPATETEAKRASDAWRELSRRSRVVTGR